MFEWLLKLKLYRLGFKYVNAIKSGKYKGIVYGVKPYTDIWGFWYITDTGKLISIDTCDSRETAEFKLNILMGVH